MPKYDYLIVGAGLFGAVFACEARRKGKTCLVIERRDHIGGNCYTQRVEGIDVHQYGAHIFHTSDEAVWNYVCAFATFNRFTNSPVAVYRDKLYNMPFNMNTFNALWGTITPEQARARVDQQIKEAGITGDPKNLEEQALRLVGRDVYETLIKGYTEKQWGRPCDQLPAFIIRRLPLRFTYDNNYFSDVYQGIPTQGYTQMIANMLGDTPVRLGVDYLAQRSELDALACKTIYTGRIDDYYGRCYGELEFRTLRFDTKVMDTDNFQGNAVVNYTASDIPYTRVIEHKHFNFGQQEKTVVTYEYPVSWTEGSEPYYPLNDDKNNALYKQYAARAMKEDRLIFGGRLGQYRYYDMHNIVSEALKLSETELA